MVDAGIGGTTTLLEGPIPLYRQLRQVIREQIAAGEWKPGDRIPTIRELCQRYGVSRTTVVQAVNALIQEGLLTGRQGKGIFISRPKVEQGPFRLVSFTEEMIRREFTPGTKMLALFRTPAPTEVARKLGLEPGESVVVLERLRLADGEPRGVMRSYLPERFFPGLADMNRPIESLYQLIQDSYGAVPTTAVDSYEPTRVDPATAALLNVRPGALAFSVERVTRDQRGRQIEYTVSVLRGDRHRVVVELRRPDL